MNSLVFCAVVGFAIVLGLIEAAFDWRAEKKLGLDSEQQDTREFEAS